MNEANCYDCNYCMYQAHDLKTCLREGVCQGAIQSTGIEHVFHEFTFDELVEFYKSFRTFQLTELLVIKSIISYVIKERYNGEKRKD